jgi:hypothetical protein
MKRRIMITMAVAVFAVLSMAAVAQAASVPQAGTVAKPTIWLNRPPTTGGLTGHTYTLSCKVRNLTSVRTIVLHHEVMVINGETNELVGIPIPWTSDGSRPLDLRYGNGGYWQGTINFLFTITPPVMPGDHIVCRWSASYGTGAAQVQTYVDIASGTGTP